LIKAHALHVIRSLVTPPEYTLLPPYITLEDLEKSVPRRPRTQRSIGNTPNQNSKFSADHFDQRGYLPIGRVTSVATPHTPFDPEHTPFGTLRPHLHDPSKTAQYQSENRPISPSSSVSSVQYIPASTLIEKAQKTARCVIRKCNGIHVLAAVLESPTTHYIYNIRLAVIQVVEQ
jgi:hypothetical protein